MTPWSLPSRRHLRRATSLAVGWLADRRVPGPLRKGVYGGYSRITGADPSEAQLALQAYPSLGAFFVRRLRPGARPLDPSPEHLISPCDGRIQARDQIRSGSLLQAKGRAYPVEELLAGAAPELQLEGAWALTIYLGPSDYHRVHVPVDCQLSEVRWIPGDRLSVAPKVVAARPRVFSINERAVLRLESDHGPMFLVMVGALNVGRIRVVGVPPQGTPAAPIPLGRGDEIARFEMGSTVILILPPGTCELLPAAALGQRVRLGEALGTFQPRPEPSFDSPADSPPSPA